LNAKQLLDDYKALKKEGREYEHIDIAKEYLLNGRPATRSVFIEIRIGGRTGASMSSIDVLYLERRSI